MNNVGKTIKLSPMKAIKAKCADCIYDPLSGGTKQEQIENCLDTLCSLYEHRPLTKKTRDSIKDARIKAMNPDERMAYDERANKARERLAKLGSNRKGVL